MDDVSPGFTIDRGCWDKIAKEGLTFEGSPPMSPWLGSEPMHVYFADGRKENHQPWKAILHYGDETLEITNEQIWRVLNELFGCER